MQREGAVKNSGYLAAKWTLTCGHTGPASIGMQTRHTDTEQRHLPCPRNWESSAAYSQLHSLKICHRRSKTSCVLACISKLLIPSQFSKSSYFSVAQLIKTFACRGQNTLPARGYMKNTSTKAFPWQWSHSRGIAALLENYEWTSCPKEQVISVKLEV